MRKFCTDKVIGYSFALIWLLLFALRLPQVATLEGDALEIIAGVDSFGVIHSPGFPTYMVVAKAFTLLTWFLPVAVSVALFSSLCASLCGLVSYNILRELGVSRGVGLLGPSIALSAYEFQYHSLIAEVYTFAVLWMALLLWSAFKYHKRKDKLSTSVFLFFALSGFGVHVYLWPFSFLALIFFGWNLWKKSSKVYLFPWILSAIFSLASFLYIPLRAGRSTYIDQGHINSVSRFFDHILWKLHFERLNTYASERIAFDILLEQKWRQLVFFWESLLFDQWHFTVVIGFGILLLASFIYGDKVSKVEKTIVGAFVFFFGLVWIVFSGNQFNESVMSEMQVHMIPVYFLFSLWLALRISALKTSWRRGAAFVFSLAILICFVRGFHRTDLSKNKMAEIHGKDILEELPRRSLLFGVGDTDLMSVIFQMSVRNDRRDVAVVNLFNGSHWYYDSVKKLYPHLSMPATYSQLFQIRLALVELDRGTPIYFSSYSAARAFLNHPSIKGKYKVIPVHRNFRLLEISKNDTKFIKKTSQFRQQVGVKFSLRGKEEDLYGQYMDYHRHRAMWHLQNGRREMAKEEVNLAMAWPIGNSKFNSAVRRELDRFKLNFSLALPKSRSPLDSYTSH